jgi:D-alanine-D-alanine ligase
MRVALIANLKQNAPEVSGAGGDAWDDLDSPKTIDAILGALRSGGHEAEFFEGRLDPPFDLVARLLDYTPDLCFNIAEGHFGIGREAHVPAVLEALRLPYTGSRVMTLALSLDKPMTKRVLHYHELPTPEFQVIGRVDEPLNEDLVAPSGDLRFPLFAKPSREGTGMGVSGKSIAETEAELREVLSRLLERYRQPVLVERYIDGRELTVGVLGNLKPTAARRLNDRTAPEILPEELTFFPPMEIDTGAYGPEERGLYTGRIKVDLVDDFRYLCPAPVDPALKERLELLTAATFRVLGCHDVARVDFRVDTQGNPYILEINPLPGLNPGYSDLCIEAKAAGWEYPTLINGIVDAATARYATKEEQL